MASCLFKFRDLGIEGVDLYGETEHNSMTDLKKYFSPEKIKKASRISSNKAMDRNLQFELANSVEIYKQASAPISHRISTTSSKNKVVEITKKS
jgi:hypothetical protein